MAIYGKVWGTTEGLIATPLFELHRLVVKPNAQCSQHHHRFKHNAFLVVKGELHIHVEKNDYELTDVTVLREGDVMTVGPGEVHWFQTGSKPCTAYEIYFTEPLSKDIIRRNVGSLGRVKAKRKR